MSTDAIIWEGAEALRPFLVPIDELEPFPGNPRRGDVEAVRASLRRFGQTRPILSDASNARRIVAGHHVRLAAQAEEWSHVAVIPNEFVDEDEARAFLLADNRTAELGYVDNADLVEHLRMLADLDKLVGTGYTTDDLDGFMADLAKLSADLDGERVPVSFTARKPTDAREVVLMYSPAQLAQVEAWLAIVKKETGADGVSEQVYEALKIAAAQLNG